jgi:hypothetical protein
MPDMRKIFTVFLIVCSATAIAQRSVEAGIMLGASNYMGELTHSNTENFHFAGGLVGRFNLNDYFSLKGNVFYGNISGADSLSDDVFKRERNLSFKSFLFEFGANVEWNIFGYDPVRTKGKAFTPYIFTGIAVYKYNPLAYLDGTWVELQPISTEGQGTTQFQDRRKYSLTQLAVPFGAGFKLRMAKGWTMSVEYGLRRTFNDYLDDISKTYVEPGVLSAAFGENSSSVRLADRSLSGNPKTYDPLTFVGPDRGTPKTNDWYAYAGVTFTYTILGNRVKCYKF